jgi:peptidyl-tRNA hydrolase
MGKDERVKFSREINSSGEPILTVSSEFVSLLTSSITISADEIDCDGGEVR